MYVEIDSISRIAIVEKHCISIVSLYSYSPPPAGGIRSLNAYSGIVKGILLSPGKKVVM